MNQSNEVYRRRINKAIDFVNSNLDRNISLEELAAESFFSPYHFHRIFVAVTGESVHNFTTRMQLEKAAKLLTFSKQAIAAIAYECCFSSPATFSRSFKKYFGVSASTYRKEKKIENSKICKDLFPIEQYHYDMNEAELRKTFPVIVQSFPERKIGYIRVPNSFEDGVVIEAFSQLIKWAKKAGIFESEKVFGMSKDDPLTTPKDKYTYEVCITLPENFKVKADHYIDTMTMPACKYAVTKVSGDFNLAATGINFLYNTWLINSEYEPEHLPGLEIFNDKSAICDWSHLDLDLCIPVKAIKTL